MICQQSACPVKERSEGDCNEFKQMKFADTFIRNLQLEAATLIFQFMKQIVFIFLTFFLIESAFTQNSKFNIGVEAGPNCTYLKRNTFDMNSDYPIFRFSSGLTFNYKITNLFSIGTGIAFEQKGNISDYHHTDLATAFPPFTYDEWRDISRFNYLTLPIFLKITFGKNKLFFADAGCFMSYLISENLIRQSKYFPKEVYDYTDSFKRFDYGITAGVGMSKPIKDRIVISFEARNNLGVFDLIDDKGWSYNQILKTNSVNFLVGVKYSLKCKNKETK